MPNSGTCSMHNEVNLPLIKLPSFTGKYNEWQSVNDLFESLIHNNKKLKSVVCLSGEPEDLLRNLTITDANYEEAWLLLKRRYDNKRFNCNAVLKTLFSIKQINHESASALKLILDTTLSCLKQLKNLGIDIASWDAIVVYIVVSKLDSESHKQWEIQMSNTAPEEMPKWSQLAEFLEARFRALEMIDTSRKEMENTLLISVKQSQEVEFIDGIKEIRKRGRDQTNPQGLLMELSTQMPAQVRPGGARSHERQVDCAWTPHSGSSAHAVEAQNNVFLHRFSISSKEKLKKEEFLKLPTFSVG
ncbi:unnamed protein product [Leptidea sinapis]|uniref:Uncharacterized protein n=1 Tax=Leptidea sinapis TaxID=189913 RepID=A0A5E4QPX5_9NEOP|nr:unnamed protein product [Leptidea sinapis]